MFGGKLALRLRTPSDQTLPLWREPAGPSQRLRGSIAPSTPKRPQPSPPAALNRPAAELPDQDWPRPARTAPPRHCRPSRNQGCGTGGANIARPQLILIQDQAQIVRSAFARWWQGRDRESNPAWHCSTPRTPRFGRGVEEIVFIGLWGG
jgi:hypothetical protein